jgi:hypothetical protein
VADRSQLRTAYRADEEAVRGPDFGRVDEETARKNRK